MHRDNSVAVTLQLSGDPKAVSEYLSDKGISPRHAGEDYIEVFLPVRMLTEVAKLDGIIRIEPIAPPQTNHHPRQAATSPAEAHGAHAWHAAGLKGAGVKVGIIDVGFKGISTLLGTELPATVEARCYRTSTDSPVSLADCDNGDHGTIVAEALSDIAPEATLYLGGIRTRGDLADVVDWMIAEDVSIINVSLTWHFDGPGDGTSPRANSPLNIVTRATASGILWLSSAGNQGESSWLGAPTDIDADGILELNGHEQLTLNSGGPHSVQLRWDGNWNASGTDLDIHILDAAGNIVVESLNPQDAKPGQHPHEVASTKQADTILQITSNSDELPSWLQVLAWNASISETNEKGSIGSPAESADPAMLAVGAANWQRTHQIEGYSSRGPTTDGRIKPDLVASACGYATYPSPNRLFCGTSQAAPHVAGMAALVLHAFPDLGNEQVARHLTANALDRGAPGPDNVWGAGFSMLPPLPTSTPTSTPTATPIPAATPTPTTAATATPTPGPNYDREALEALYHATNGDNWDNNYKWLTDAPLDEWRGIHLDSEGRVSSLSLTNNKLSGVIPPEIAHLSHLRALHLSGNEISGIPPELAKLSRLWSLYLDDNNLSGTIPAFLSRLSNLRNLGLSNNQLTGEIPPSLHTIPHLGGVNLAYNQLSGEIPPELGTLKRLTHLDLSDNHLTGHIPDALANLENLEWLFINNNRLGGPIPAALQHLPNVSIIRLQDNELSGPIPPELGNAPQLLTLNLGNNNLSGAIPPELGNSPKLKHLDLQNNQLTGELPPKLASIPSLREVRVNGNSLTGPLPHELLELTDLQELYFHDNDRLCIPDDEAFEDWLRKIRKGETPSCNDGIYDAERAQFFSQLNYREYERHGHFIDWIDSWESIRVPVGPYEYDTLNCDKSVIGNSLTPGENPTLNDYSHIVYVYVEGGRNACIGLSKHVDLDNWERSVAVLNGLDAQKDEPLEFLTDEKLAAGTGTYTTPPYRGGYFTHQLEELGLECTPQHLPMAAWSQKEGFYRVSDEDRVATFENIEPGSADSALGTGWFYIVELRNNAVSQQYCWHVPNWTEAPLRPCPACQLNLKWRWPNR